MCIYEKYDYKSNLWLVSFDTIIDLEEVVSKITYLHSGKTNLSKKGNCYWHKIFTSVYGFIYGRTGRSIIKESEYKLYL